MSLEDDYVLAMSRLNDNPYNHSLLLKIQAYVNSLHTAIETQEAEYQTLLAAHTTQKLSDLLPQAISEIEAIYENHQLQFYTEI